MVEPKGAGTSWVVCLALCYWHHLSCALCSLLPSGDQPLRLTGKLLHPQPKTMNIGTFMQNLYLEHVCHWAGQSSWNSKSLHYTEKYKSSFEDIQMCFADVTSLHPPSPVVTFRSLVVPALRGMPTAISRPLPVVFSWDPPYLPMY